MAAPDLMYAYYRDRAPYMAKNLESAPAGQLLEIIAELKALARDKAVLEIACGTGYFTRFAGPVSQCTVAVDYSEAMLDVARSQHLAKVRLLHDDAYRLDGLRDEQFEFGFAMHWVSHIPHARWHEFFTGFHSRLQPGAKVLLADDIRRPDDRDPYYSKLATHDTYEIRRLPAREPYEIVKTFFTAVELRTLLQPYAGNLQIRYERPRWWLTYEVKQPS